MAVDWDAKLSKAELQRANTQLFQIGLPSGVDKQAEYSALAGYLGIGRSSVRKWLGVQRQRPCIPVVANQDKSLSELPDKTVQRGILCYAYGEHLGVEREPLYVGKEYISTKSLDTAQLGDGGLYFGGLAGALRWIYREWVTCYELSGVEWFVPSEAWVRYTIEWRNPEWIATVWYHARFVTSPTWRELKDKETRGKPMKDYEIEALAKIEEENENIRREVASIYQDKFEEDGETPNADFPRRDPEESGYEEPEEPEF